MVIVGALSQGLDDAQDEVLKPLTGVGTDLSVSRPIAVPDDDASAGGGSGDPFGRLSKEDQRQLQRENEEHSRQFNFGELGDPGERFSKDSFMSTKLSFPTSEVADIQALDGIEDAAATLTLNAVHIEGEVPESGAPALGAGAHGGGGVGATGGFELDNLSVSGVDVGKPGLAMVTPDRVARGRYFSRTPAGARGEAVVNLAYARRNGIEVGEDVTVSGKEFEVVGLSSAPLGGDAADVYVEWVGSRCSRTASAG